MIQNSIEYALIVRFVEIQKIKAAFREIESTLPDRFLRGPAQIQILTIAGMPKTGLNKRLVNDVLATLGFTKVTIHGCLHFKRVK